jgi:hypothetical protein
LGTRSVDHFCGEIADRPASKAESRQAERLPYNRIVDAESKLEAELSFQSLAFRRSSIYKQHAPRFERGALITKKWVRLFSENFFNVSDFLFHFASDFLGCAAISQIRVSDHFAGFLLNFADCFLRCAFDFVVCA